jgi:hypothetical protein
MLVRSGDLQLAVAGARDHEVLGTWSVWATGGLRGITSRCTRPELVWVVQVPDQCGRRRPGRGSPCGFLYRILISGADAGTVDRFDCTPEE